VDWCCLGHLVVKSSQKSKQKGNTVPEQKDNDGAKKEVGIHVAAYRQISDEKRQTFVTVDAMKF